MLSLQVSTSVSDFVYDCHSGCGGVCVFAHVYVYILDVYVYSYDLLDFKVGSTKIVLQYQQTNDPSTIKYDKHSKLELKVSVHGSAHVQVAQSTLLSMNQSNTRR